MANKKTKLSIFFYRVGLTNNEVGEIIAAHNEGLNLVLLNDICKVIKKNKSKYFSVEDMKVELIEDEGKLNVYENGKDLTYSIEELEYYTLNMVDDSNLSKHIAGEDALFLENPICQLYKKNL